MLMSKLLFELCLMQNNLYCTTDVVLILLYFSRYNVALSNCCIGDSCVIHNGVCIGQDGKVGFLSFLVLYSQYTLRKSKSPSMDLTNHYRAIIIFVVQRRLMFYTR